MQRLCAVCNLPSLSVCGGCKLVHYCGKDHQKMHWALEHKKNCNPLYKLEQNEKLGRYLVATKDINKGDIIFQEAPLVIGPRAVTTPVCLGCHNICDINKYHECDGCGFPLCSAKCQVSDFHMDECRLMMEAKFRADINMTTNQKEISYMPIVPLRCLLLKDKSLEKYKKVMNLQSHIENRMKTPLFDIYKKNVGGFIRERLQKTEYDEKSILTVLGILDTNSFEIRTHNSKLRGLYNTASMLAHNCKPNTKHSFLMPDMTMVVIATRDIEAGEIISATYTQTFWNTSSRREHLKSVKYFECDCERCTDPTELGSYAGAIRCTKCVTANNAENECFILSKEPLKTDSLWMCQNCGYQMTWKQIKSGNENLKEELSRKSTKTVQGLEEFLIKYGVYEAGVLHPKNYHVVQAKHALIQLIGNSDGHFYSEISDHLLDRKINYCHDLLDFVDIVDPGFSKIRGEILNELQSAMAIQTKRLFNQNKITKEEAQASLLNAMTILREVIEILKFDLNVDEFEKKLMMLKKDLDD